LVKLFFNEMVGVMVVLTDPFRGMGPRRNSH